MRLWYVLFLPVFFLPVPDLVLDLVPDLVPDPVPRGNNKGQSKGGRVAKCLEKGYRMIAQIREHIRGKNAHP